MQITMMAIVNFLTNQPTGLFPNVGKYVHDIWCETICTS